MSKKLITQNCGRANKNLRSTCASRQSNLQFHILTQAKLHGLIWIGAILPIGVANLRVVALEGFHSLGIVG